MAKLTLELEEDYDFQLIGICSHVKDYRISWEINQALQFDLSKMENYSLIVHGEEHSFPFYEQLDEIEMIDYYMLGNRSSNGLLIPEESKCDYFFLCKGHISENEVSNLSKKIAKLKSVLTSYVIEVENLKSKSNLIF